MSTENFISLSTIPTISYSYRLIHSYFAIFHKIFEYNKIKNAVLKINNWNNEYLNYYIFYSVVFSAENGKSFDFELCNSFYHILFEERINDETIDFLKNVFAMSNKQTAVAKLIRKIAEARINEGYFIFLMMSMHLNRMYSSLIVLPIDLFERIEHIHNDYIFGHYINGLILGKCNSLLRDDLFTQIEALYSSKKDFLANKYGIIRIYLFGSIALNEYHRESDIDMVIELSSSKVDFADIIEEISSLNMKNFKRKSDIYEYSYFVERNKHIDLRLLLQC